MSKHTGSLPQLLNAASDKIAELRSINADLLEALEGLVGCCTLTSKRQAEMHTRARAAIAKARGTDA